MGESEKKLEDLTEQEKRHLAAMKFIECRGYEVLDEDYDGYIIIKDEINAGPCDNPDIAFIKVWDMSNDEEPEVDRKSFEAIMFGYMAEHDVSDVSVRLDHIGVKLWGDRAMIAHHIHVTVK